jgi:hypothetical protein
MTNTMSEKELSELKTVFKELDANGDGSVTVTELSQALEKAGTSARKEEILQLLASADIDGDGSLSFEVRTAWKRCYLGQRYTHDVQTTIVSPTRSSRARLTLVRAVHWIGMVFPYVCVCVCVFCRS